MITNRTPRDYAEALGQERVHEDEFVFGTGAARRRGREASADLVSFVPHRVDLRYEFGYHL